MAVFDNLTDEITFPNMSGLRLAGSEETRRKVNKCVRHRRAGDLEETQFEYFKTSIKYILHGSGNQLVLRRGVDGDRARGCFRSLM